MTNKKLLHLIFNIKKALLYPIYSIIINYFMNEWITLGVERERKIIKLREKIKKRNEEIEKSKLIGTSTWRRREINKEKK